MRVERLTAVNIKRIEEINIAPAKDAHLVIIGGNNGQGKTSSLDCIEYAIGGKRTHPARPIRDGEEYAEILLDLGNWIVKRVWRNNDSSRVTVESKDGAIVKGPQAWLDAVFGPLSFDPLKFAQMEPRKQFDTLKDLVGLDLGPLEGKRQRIYEERTEINRYLKESKGQLAAFPVGLESAPDEPIVIADLVKQSARVTSMDRDFNDMRARLGNLEVRILETKELLAALESQRASLEHQREQLAGELVDLPSAKEINEKIANAEKTNEKVRLKRERIAVKDAISGYESDERRLTKKLADIDREKQAQIAAAKFPIAGLALEEGRVLFDGVPFDQAAESQKLRVSVAMGLAMNPEFKVLLIRDGSLLDLDSLKEVEEMAREHGAQIFIERVGKQGPVSFVIEDGRVLAEVAQ